MKQVIKIVLITNKEKDTTTTIVIPTEKVYYFEVRDTKVDICLLGQELIEELKDYSYKLPHSYRLDSKDFKWAGFQTS